MYVFNYLFCITTAKKNQNRHRFDKRIDICCKISITFPHNFHSCTHSIQANISSTSDLWDSSMLFMYSPAKGEYLSIKRPYVYFSSSFTFTHSITIIIWDTGLTWSLTNHYDKSSATKSSLKSSHIISNVWSQALFIRPCYCMF